METGEITLLALDCLSSRLNAGLRSNEALANRAIQLFGLFRVFGEQLVGSQTNLRETKGPTFSPLIRTLARCRREQNDDPCLSV